MNTLSNILSISSILDFPLCCGRPRRRRVGVDTDETPLLEPKTDLFHRPEFKLVRVERATSADLGSGTTMSVISPYNLVETEREEIRHNGYYCFSHYWGQEHRLEEWKDHPVCGVTSKVTLRPEKRPKLLQLLKSTTPQGGVEYWWIDVFCATESTPLGIMGEIYKNCKTCYTFLDCRPDCLVHLMSDKENTHLQDMRIRTGFSEDDVVAQKLFAYRTRMDEAPVMPDQTDWRRHFERMLFSTSAASNDSANTRAAVLADVLCCNWFRRGWTLQEAVLPSRVIVTSETGPLDASMDLTILVNVARNFYNAACALKSPKRKPLFKRLCSSGELSSLPTSTNSDYQVAKTMHTNHIKNMLTDIEMIGNLRDYYIHNTDPKTSSIASLTDVLQRLGKSTRLCTDEFDYIHCFIGMLGIDTIPPIRNDWDKLWKMFKDELIKRDIVVPVHPPSMDDATNMAAVYSSLLYQGQSKKHSRKIGYTRRYYRKEEGRCL